ncbi:DsbA family protein [Dryocola sp. LX212]|jgi:protein-disulfide isomerase
MTLMTSRPTLLALLLMSTLSASAAETAVTANNADQVGKMAEEYLVAHPEKIGEVLSTYLAEHPEFLVAAGENLRQRQQQAQQEAMVQLALEHQAELLSKDTPSVGPVDAKAAVVMFFDYQCAYCSKMAPVVESLVKANPDVRFVFKELPIFAPRWPVSGQAARTGLKIWQEKGADAYIAYHNGLYATGHNEGALTQDDVHQIAAPYLSKDTLVALDKNAADSKENAVLKANTALAQTMHFTGTPAFVVMPQNKGTATQITVLPGATEQSTLQTAISKASGK